MGAIKQIEQAYKTYLDSLRLDRFKGYKRAIDSADLGAAQAAKPGFVFLALNAHASST
jgi:hypothetical protein